MAMIAKRCGVHCSTVQRALKSKGRISSGTVAQIRAVAAEMGYDPAQHQAAARLIALRHGTRVLNRVVALYLPAVFYQHTYYLRIMRGILEVLAAEHFDLLTTAFSSEDPRLPVTIVSGGVDGVIAVVEPNSFASRLADLRATPYFGEQPVVSLIHALEGASSVRTDDYTGARLACDHLLDLGHREIACFVVDRRDSVAAQRIRGVEDALRARGLDPGTHVHYPFSRPMEPPAIARFGQCLVDALQRHPGITAILLPHDGYAFRAAQVLAQLGLRVPEEISLVGFDDTEPLLDADGHNILTTVQVPLEDLGREAARLIVRQVTGEHVPLADLTLDTALVVRKSTGPARA
jgi:LacI family transcriptional regulator